TAGMWCRTRTVGAAAADDERAVQGMCRAAFGLQVQKCSAGSRVYVHSSIRDAFADRLVALTKSIRIGDPCGRDIFMGPIINEAAFRRFEKASAEAARDGRILAGGNRLSGGIYDHGFYVEPTIVDSLPADHALHRDELFLPFLTVQVFDDLEAAIADGNAVAYGLTAGC